MTGYVMAHDLGTSSHKCTVFDMEGQIVASAVSAYPTVYKDGGVAEQDAAHWWKAVIETSRRVLQEIDAKRIAVICFSGHMMGCLPVDRSGNPIHPSLIHADTRSSYLEQCVFRSVDQHRLYQITGNRIDAHYPLLKVLWFRENRPDIYAQTAWFIQAKDYLVFRMTGQLGVTDYSDASLSGMFNLLTRNWDNEIIHELSLDRAKLPTILPSTTIVGRVSAEAARTTGLLEGTPVVLGGGDGACATAGAGAISVGDAYIYLGTTGWVSRVVSAPLIDRHMRVFHLCLNEQHYNVLGTMQTAGAAYQWAVEQLASSECLEAARTGTTPHDMIERAIAEVPCGAKGLIFHPYLLGERSPLWDKTVRGTFFGLDIKHTRFDMLRAVIEGISYGLSSIAEVIETEEEIPFYYAIGGGMKSAVWREILASVLEKPIYIPEHMEVATSLGAAIAAGVSIGAYRDFEDAKSKIKIRFHRQNPVQEQTIVYQQGYKLFRKLYENLKDIYPLLWFHE